MEFARNSLIVTLLLLVSGLGTVYYFQLSEYDQLVDRYNKQVEEYNDLLTKFRQQTVEYNDIVDKYNRLTRVPAFGYYPTPSADFRLIGYVDQAREFFVKEPSILIRFKNPSECLRRVFLSGRSMMPMMGDGTEIIMNRCFRADALRVGDIIAFTDKAGDHVIHQIIEIAGNGVVTKGINNRNSDGILKWDRIEAQVVGVMF